MEEAGKRLGIDGGEGARGPRWVIDGSISVYLAFHIVLIDFLESFSSIKTL